MRIISRLDVKSPNLVKGINFEGLRKLGSPAKFAIDYYNQGIDEILFIDIVASLYQRNSLLDIIAKSSEGVFVPITVGGGIRSIDDIKSILRSGADKVAINTAAIQNPTLIKEAAHKFGKQCIVGSIQAKKISNQKWECYYDCGREKSGIDVLKWAVELAKNDVGEILVSSVDRDGCAIGPDFELIKSINNVVEVPIIASSGFSNEKHFYEADACGIDAIAIGTALHFKNLTVAKIKKDLSKNGINIRRDST